MQPITTQNSDQTAEWTYEQSSSSTPTSNPTDVTTIAVLGLGYVGLPTSLALTNAGFNVIGIDISESRLQDIRSGSADLLPQDQNRLSETLGTPALTITNKSKAMRDAAAVVICVPTPVDEQLRPDLRALRATCRSVVEHATTGQILICTSTSYVGTTQDLLVKPLQEKGFTVGEDVFVAFSPERIDPGRLDHVQDSTPRVVGAVTPACLERAVAIMEPTASHIHTVSSPEAAELTKLYENTFRAVNIAFANEMATMSQHYGIDPMEITEAAATKPYGFMPFYPGPGVGGHCIPCDPHYLLQPIHEAGSRAPIVEESMKAIAERPKYVAQRALKITEHSSTIPARILVIGIAYKPGVMDMRESPAVEIFEELQHAGVQVDYHDPLINVMQQANGSVFSVAQPQPEQYDLAVVAILHPGHDYSWVEKFEHVLDCTYKTTAGNKRYLV